MDYSLYLTVEKANISTSIQQNNIAKTSGNRNILFSEDGTEIYHLGVIDYLQKWDSSKKREKFFKVKVLNAKWRELSAVEPYFYRERWLDFVG